MVFKDNAMQSWTVHWFGSSSCNSTGASFSLLFIHTIR